MARPAKRVVKGDMVYFVGTKHTISQNHYRCSSGGLVWAGTLFEFLTLLLVINHYKTTNSLPSKKPEQHLSNNYSIHQLPYHFIAHSYHVMISKLESSVSFPVATSLEGPMPHQPATFSFPKREF